MFGGVRKGLQALYWQSWSVKKQKRSWSSLFEQASCQDPLRKRVKGFSDGWNRAGEERYQLDGKVTRLTVQTVVQLLPILWAFLWHLYWILLDSLAALALKFLWSCEKKSHFSPILSLPLIFFFFSVVLPSSSEIQRTDYCEDLILMVWLWDQKVTNGETGNGEVQVSTGTCALAVLQLICDISGQLNEESPWRNK